MYEYSCFILLGPLSLPFSGVFSPFPSPLHVHFGPCSGYVSIFRALAPLFIYLFIYFVRVSFVVSLFITTGRSSPVVQCIASNTTEIGVVSSNPGGRKHTGLFSRKTPIIAESAE